MINLMLELRSFIRRHCWLSLGARYGVPLLLVLSVSQASHAVVYLKPEEALQQLFASSDVVKADKKPLGGADQEKIRERLGYPISTETITFFVGFTGDTVDGYVLMDQQIGKTQPITFMTLIGPDGKVREIEVLAYRESQGSQIRYRRFREQFHGKGHTDALQVGRDIQNITGATLSVRATTEVVRRALILWNYFYGSEARP